MTTTASGARSDDSGSLKWKITSYMPENPDTQSVEPPMREKQDYKKVNERAFNHKACARFLCLRPLLELFDEDPE
jgi:hypothetical protein